MNKIFSINLVLTTKIHSTAHGFTDYIDVYSQADNLDEAKKKAINHMQQTHNIKVSRAGGYPAIVQDANRYIHLIK